MGFCGRIVSVHHLANLQWLLHSAPLLAKSHPMPQVNFSERDWPETFAIDEWDSASLTTLAAHTRLGKYAEDLLWLALHEKNALWKGVDHHVVIASTERTLGELDFIVQHRPSQRFEHWELAVKFYLGTDECATPRDFIGPNQSDRLDKKLSKLNEHQLALGQHYFRHAGISAFTSKAILKGRLFYPLTTPSRVTSFLHPLHEQGRWASAAQWQATLTAAPTQTIKPLTRLEWFNPRLAAAPEQSFSEFLALYELGDGRAEALWHVQRQQMLFVVSQGWLAGINQAKHTQQ